MSTPRLQAAFHALADPTRRRILELLEDGERPVTALLPSFSITQSAVSQHLAVLSKAGLVRVRRSGRRHMYSLGAPALRTVARWAAGLTRAKPR